MIKRIIARLKSNKLKSRFLKDKKAKIAKKASIDDKTTVGFNVYAGDGDYRGASIGDNSYIGSGAFYKCSIGKFCSIGHNVAVISGNHPLDSVSTSPAFIKDSTCLMKKRYVTKPFCEYVQTSDGFNLEIGNDVWIGNNVLVKGGIKIGDGAVIGMGSVVTKDVPPYAIVVGNPATIIRYRFNEDIINKLQQIKWWNFSEKELFKYSELFDDVDSFVRTYLNNERNN